MSDVPPRPPHQAFIDQLRKLRRDCGNPSYAELRRLSQQPTRPGLRLRVLTETTTQEILAGKRAGLPDWAWVAAFVTACRAAAAELALDPAQLGTIEDWHRKWSAAHDTDQPSSAPTPHDRGVPAGGVAALFPPPPPGPPQPKPDDGSDEHTAEFGPAAERSQTLNRYLHSYGQLGGRLLIAAENNDPDAAYRIGVLLWCDGHPKEGLAWLEQATRAGNSDAAALCHAPSRTAAAAEAAYQLGQTSDHDGDPAAALVYYQKAAKCGHADAAYRAGAKLTDAGDPFAAGYWLDRAARLGHPDAGQQFEKNYRRVRRDMNPPW